MDHIKRLSSGGVLLAFTKIGKYAVAPPEEMYILHSPNLLTEEDPTMVVWEVLPNRSHGVGAPGWLDSAGPEGVSEEPHVVPMLAGGTEDDQVYIAFRTSQGYLGATTGHLRDSSDAAWPNSTFAAYRR